MKFRDHQYYMEQKPFVERIVRNTLYEKTKSHCDVEDVVQSVFKSVYRISDDPRTEVSNALLTCITKRKALKRNRYVQRQCRNVSRTTQLSQEPLCADDTALLREIWSDFMLNANDQVVLTAEMSAKGVGNAEIAKALSVSERTIRRHIQCAIEILTDM